MRARAEIIAGPPVAGHPGPECPEWSFELVYEEHFSFVWRSLRGLGVEPTLLDDAAQEVFLVAHRRGKDFEGRSSLRTWLFGIAHGVAANFRRAARRKATQPLSCELSSDRPNPEQHAASVENARFVESFLDGVEEDQRAVFVACVLEEMSVPEAADALGGNINTLYSRLRAVRAGLAAALARREATR